MSGLGIVKDGIIACQDGKIIYAGSQEEAPAFEGDVIDCEGRWITPGLIDCHTHLVYGGERIADFEKLLGGRSYTDVARAGGGIRTTMQATRNSSLAELVKSALPRLDALLCEGVTTVEVKSGYGLTLEHEIKQLRAARQLEGSRKVTITTTYLAAHVLPPEFGNADDFIAEVCEVMLPRICGEKLADAVDAFCDAIGFSAAQTERLFEAAKALDLPVKLHSEQLSNQKGAVLAARFGALSADHLEYLDEDGAAAMAGAGTVAVLLPGAYYFTRETQIPPIHLLRKHGVPMAIASDCNPGTSPMTSLLLAMNMAAVLFRLSVPECLVGVTREAARALGRLDRTGTLEAGKDCDLAIWNINRLEELVYHIGLNPLHARIWRGQ